MSLLYRSRLSLVSILCLWFDIRQQLLANFGIKGQYNRIRDLSMALDNKEGEMGTEVLLEHRESLRGKRVNTLEEDMILGFYPIKKACI